MLMNALLRQYGSEFPEKPKIDMLFYTDKSCIRKGYELTEYCRSKGYSVEVLFNKDHLERMNSKKYRFLVMMEDEKICVTSMESGEMKTFTREHFEKAYTGRNES